jgi:uncharacterized sulfatase
MSALRKGDWKMVEDLTTGAVDLYNLRYDVSEMTDLKFSYTEKAAEMKQALERWQRETDARNPVPNPDFDPARRYEWGKNPYRK